MADIAGFCLDVGRGVDFRGRVGEFDLALFVIDSDIFDAFLIADIGDDLRDVIAGIEHHGIMGSQTDRVGQTIRIGDDVVHDSVFLFVDIKIGPGGHGQQQGHADTQNEFGNQAATRMTEQILHGSP